MQVNGLKTYQFRNIKNQTINFHERLNFLIGNNGQGKTNVLEAIHFLLHGQSFRPVVTSGLICYDKIAEAPESALFGKVKKKELNFDLCCQIRHDKKNHLLNNKTISGLKLIREFPIIVFSPESLSAIKEGPEMRRNLIDELLIIHDKNNANLINSYKKIWKTRNQVLRNYAHGQKDINQTKAILDSYDEPFLNCATELTVARLNAISAILEDLNYAMGYIFKENFLISIDYIISQEKINLSTTANYLKNMMANRLTQLRTAELSVGNSLVGPHKHDIQFCIDGHDSRYHSSQGQQRGLILSFKLAQVLYHNRIHDVFPILMLDDVLSELDIGKQSQLISFLQTFQSQMFITTTDIALPKAFSQQSGIVYIISNGELVSS